MAESSKNMNFTVVMAVYAGDAPAHVKQAIDSLLSQTLPPTEILIAVDGPVGRELNTLLEGFETRGIARLHRLPVNSGPGTARDSAIRRAGYDVIAIMDADDVCDVRRFEKQVPIVAEREADMVGAWIEEFHIHPGDTGKTRIVPEKHEDIYRYGRWRQPMNHVTIVMNREAYLASGGYGTQRYVEDYDLIVRMLIKGFVLHNVPEVLVHVRGGDDYVDRRHGKEHLREEVSLYHRMRLWRYINGIQMYANIALRAVMRLLPFRAFSFIYRTILRRDAVSTVH